MPRERPLSVVSAAVLALLYGGLFTLCNLFGLISVATQGMINQALAAGNPQQQEMQKKIEEAMERDVPGYRVMQIATPVVGLVEALAILIAGIGLLGMYSWARTLALAATWFAIISRVCQAVFQAVFVIPASGNALEAALPGAMPPGPAAEQFGKMMRAMIPAMMFLAVGFLVLTIIYLSIIVFLLMRRHVREAFAAPDVPAGAMQALEREEEDAAWQKPLQPKNPEDDWRIQ
jgi:hypothetical protein